MIDEIRKISRRVTTNHLEQLRIEEELLILFIRNQDVSIASKTEALIRIKLINKEQIEILGGL